MLAECLDGIRVLDLSQYIPGPFATRMLADLGARVVKVEPPGGDPMRRFPAGGNEISPLYGELNAGKRVVYLDLKSEKDREAFDALVAGADVLLESFRPGVMERLGFGPKRLREINPRLIHCTLTGFGQTGPHRDRAGHDLSYMALTGGLNATGSETAPAVTFPPLADHAGAMQAAVTILGALFRRERAGEGVHLDVSLFEAALSWQAMGLQGAGGASERIERATGLLTGGAAYYRIYRTGDGRYMALAALEEKFWRRFCEAVGRPEWTSRQTEPLPQKEMIAEVTEVFARLTFAEWIEFAEGHDCCLEPVLDYDEVIAHPQVLARNLVKGRDESTCVETLFPAWLNGRPPRERVPVRPVSAGAVIQEWARREPDAAGSTRPSPRWP